jgi:hypothetical protein
MRNWLCFFCGILLLFAIQASQALPVRLAPHPVAQIQQNDSVKIQLRKFNEQPIAEYAKLKDFQYNDTSSAPISFWDRFWRWVWRFIENVFRGISVGKSSWLIFRIVLFILAAGFVVYIVFKILGIDIVKIFRGESKGIAISYTESLENIHDINFDTEIENAISNRNYRLAVRLLYLRSLKQLNDAKLIHWQIEKTNSTYLNELTDTEHKQLFSLLTRQFEYVWYGDFPVDGPAFQNINTLFINFKKVLP